jgi:hypothetical protein
MGLCLRMFENQLTQFREMDDRSDMILAELLARRGNQAGLSIASESTHQ